MQEKLSQFKHLSLFFTIGMVTILLGIVFAIVYVSLKSTNESVKQIPKPTQQPTNQQQVGQNIAVTSIIPSEATTLIASEKQTFTVSFSTTLDANAVTFSLTPDDDSQEISAPKIILRQPDPKTISLEVQGSLEPFYNYTLTIQDKLSQKILASQTYYVAPPQPTAIPNNNQTLKTYLPYETNTYSLEYLPDRNIYLFHFKYNDSSDVESDVQFENAKAAATQFIESKGIQISDITIEWRSS